MGMKLPSYLTKYFWGDNLSQLSWDQHKSYITETVLEKGDKKAVGWLFSKEGKTEIKKYLPKLKISPKSDNFWNLYLND